LEESAKIYLIAKAVGTPRVLTDEEYKEIQSLESEAYRVQLLQQMKLSGAQNKEKTRLSGSCQRPNGRVLILFIILKYPLRCVRIGRVSKIP
jgi:hypothetical protein